MRFKLFAVLFTNFNNKMRKFSRWYQLSIVLTCLVHSFGPSLGLDLNLAQNFVTQGAHLQ